MSTPKGVPELGIEHQRFEGGGFGTPPGCGLAMREDPGFSTARLSSLIPSGSEAAGVYDPSVVDGRSGQDSTDNNDHILP